MEQKLEFLVAGQCHYEDILELNEELVHYLAPMDKAHMLELESYASLFHVVKCDGKMAAFIICLEEGTAYDNENYKYFESHYDSFLYIDRIVIKPEFHRRGIGNFIYDKVFEYAKTAGKPRLTGEIDILPENPVSLAFHKTLGFEEVAKLSVYNGKKQVSLQVAELK